ncbi:MAG: sulfite exporter TauE/SafE family protein [Pseudomonadota bacterium]
MEALAASLGLAAGDFAFAVAAVFVAGVVRGFSGFALSALVMASLSQVLSPVEILPICLVLEVAASALMARAGFREANTRLVLTLVTGIVVGIPIGLYIATTATPETSRVIALGIIMTLALAQLARLSPAFLATTPGTVASGVMSGAVNGASSAGGMVVALFMLARKLPAAEARASLVVYLVLSQIFGLTFLLIFGVMTEDAFWRGLTLAVPAMAGVLVGTRLFTPRFAAYYRPFCLCLLIGLAAFGLAQALT